MHPHAAVAAAADSIPKQLDRNDLLALMAGSGSQDEGLHVIFDTHAVLNERASWGWDETKPVPTEFGGLQLVTVHHEGAGREIYDQLDYIRITIPGDRGNEIHRPVRFCGSKAQCRAPKGQPKCDPHRFPREYFAFKGDLDQQAASGTLLSMWPVVNKKQIEELKYLRIYTVEQLAAVSDGNAGSLGPGYSQLRAAAKDFLDAAKGLQPTVALRKELEAKDAQIASLMSAVEGLHKRFDEMAKAQAAAAGAPPAPEKAPEKSDKPAKK